MLRSMTGFGASANEARHGYSLQVEVRSVNHRHLAIKTRLPDAFAPLESEVEARVRSACERGAVTVHLTAERIDGADVARLNEDTARGYRRELERLARELEIAPTISLEMLIGLPGVLEQPEARKGSDEVRASVLRLVDQALEGMLEMRAQEGRALETDLRKHAAAIAKLVAKVEKRMPLVVRGHRSALERRVKELVSGPVSAADLAREIALLCDKLDVSEELARLESHLALLDELLGKGGRIGRQLDFLAQEIFREVNTIGAKCSDAKVSHAVVEAKTQVERLREQVQNVE